MAKHLLLVRNGKSDKDNIHLKDFDRPLNHRGNKNAVAMAEKLKNKQITTPFIISSPALRALSTAKHFARVWNLPQEEIQTDINIYEANITALLQVVNGLKDEADHIALFGHNPGFTDFANYLSDAKIYNMPTSGVVMIKFDVDSWQEISHHSGTMVLFEFPKNAEERY
jgi:phosphohistidine phosphatase